MTFPPLKARAPLLSVLSLLGALGILQACNGGTVTLNPGNVPACGEPLCNASTYSLIAVDLDGSNPTVVRTSPYQSMTHPRVSADRAWVLYTTYNDRDSRGCAVETNGYLNTEIRAVQLNGGSDKRVIAPASGELHSNNYWLGSTLEFTYLSGPPSAIKFYRVLVDSQMNVLGTPALIPVAGTIYPMDPQANLAANKIVFPGLYQQGGNTVKSIFMMNLSDGGAISGLSLGRDHAGNLLPCLDAECANIMENDPKISPNGAKVAFMRRAVSSGANGFGWHIFVVPVASALSEVDISYAALGSDLAKNEVLPEWLDDNTLAFSTIEISPGPVVAKQVYTMKSDGTQRTKVSLPTGFRYADVFPFRDGSGKQRLLISAEKIGASCL